MAAVVGLGVGTGVGFGLGLLVGAGDAEDAAEDGRLAVGEPLPDGAALADGAWLSPAAGRAVVPTSLDGAEAPHAAELRTRTARTSGANRDARTGRIVEFPMEGGRTDRRGDGC